MFKIYLGRDDKLISDPYDLGCFLLADITRKYTPQMTENNRNEWSTGWHYDLWQGHLATQQQGDIGMNEYHHDEDCIFCKIITRKISDFIIREDNDIIVILSLEGHPLIIPKEHIDCFCGLTPELASKIMIEAHTMAKAVRATTSCTGLNLIQSNGPDAGQEVFHFHLHVRPRWKDDGIEATWNTAELDRNKRQVLSDNLLAYLNAD